jgi:preprotein translocase subunit Sss1
MQYYQRIINFIRECYQLIMQTEKPDYLYCEQFLFP